MWFLALVIVAVVLNFILWVIEQHKNSNKYLESKPKYDNLNKLIEEHNKKVYFDKINIDAKIKQKQNEIEISINKQNEQNKKEKDDLEKHIVKHNEQVKREREDIDKMVKQKSMGFPWLAEAFADYYSGN